MDVTPQGKSLLLEVLRWYVGQEAAAVVKDEAEVGLSEAVYQLRRRVDDVLAAFGELCTAPSLSPGKADVLCSVLRSYRVDGVAATGKDSPAESSELDALLGQLEARSAPLAAEERWSRGRTLPIRLPRRPAE